MTIEYEQVNRGDILRLVGAGAPGFARNGDLLRVLERTKYGVLTEDKRGQQCEFVCGAATTRLEATEWTNDFPEVV